MARHGLKDEQWALIEDMFPQNGLGPGRPWQGHRKIMNGMLWVLTAGAPWRDLPVEFGPWQTVYERFNSYRADGTLDRIVERLQVRMDERGLIDWDLFCVDGSSVRASRAAAGAEKGGRRRSRKITRWVVLAGAGARSSTS